MQCLSEFNITWQEFYHGVFVALSDSRFHPSSNRCINHSLIAIISGSGICEFSDSTYMCNCRQGCVRE